MISYLILNINISTREVIHEAFVKQAKIFAARPSLPTFTWTNNGQTGVSLTTNTDVQKVSPVLKYQFRFLPHVSTKGKSSPEIPFKL